jgi:formamidopyrimidine-DNA glycosylase
VNAVSFSGETMPELPDLVYLEKHLKPLLRGQQIAGVEVHEPIVLRMLLPGDFAQALAGATFGEVRRHGPFLVIGLSNQKDLVIHPMLAGRLQWAAATDKTLASCALTLHCTPSRHSLRYLDDKKMGKIYLTAAGDYDKIPRFNQQGPEIFSDEFTFEYFQEQIRRNRKQVRVFLMDQSLISCIGNAYADEILFRAGIHPKTFCYQLDEIENERLYRAIREVMQWGIDEVEKAQQPLEVKVRGHMRVRNRKDQSCPKCGIKIRRAGVLGYDAFFCPACQPLKRGQFLDWRALQNK